MHGRVILSSVLLAVLLPQTAARAADSERIKAIIQSADIVPPDYRRHINIKTSNQEAAISVYRDPDAQPYDCKVDAILMADKVAEAEPAIRKVTVAFFDLADPDKYWRVGVPTSTVISYAHGQIDKDALIKATSLDICQMNPLGKIYGNKSYGEIVRELGLVPGPLKQARAVALVRIDQLEQSGHYVGELRRRFLHMEDLVRRGENEALKRELSTISRILDERIPPVSNRVESLRSLAPKVAE
jgi:hypothetical protein